EPRAVRLDLLELCHRVAMEGLLHLLGEKSAALVMEASPRRRLEDPVALVGKQDLQDVGVRGCAEPDELRDIEDDALGLDVEGARRGRVALDTRDDRLGERIGQLTLVLLEGAE